MKLKWNFHRGWVGVQVIKKPSVAGGLGGWGAGGMEIYSGTTQLSGKKGQLGCRKTDPVTLTMVNLMT